MSQDSWYLPSFYYILPLTSSRSSSADAVYCFGSIFSWISTNFSTGLITVLLKDCLWASDRSESCVETCLFRVSLMKSSVRTMSCGMSTMGIYIMLSMLFMKCGTLIRDNLTYLPSKFHRRLCP